jgi:hypothetical protein
MSFIIKTIFFITLLIVAYSNTLNAQSHGLLTDDDRERIRQQEIFREEIKRQIAEENHKFSTLTTLRRPIRLNFLKP